MDFAAQLQSATAGIDKDYFQLPVYGAYFGLSGQLFRYRPAI